MFTLFLSLIVVSVEIEVEENRNSKIVFVVVTTYTSLFLLYETLIESSAINSPMSLRPLQ